jgi:hypothetical protein
MTDTGGIDTAVALIAFNRPSLARQVFDRIAAARPPVLFLIVDGPRSDAEAGLCELVRGLADRVDWDCQVERLFATENLGIPDRMITGLETVFASVDQAIILEDDDLPDPSFFRFCETCLHYYREDRRVMEIGGSNFQLGRSRTPYSYYFSKYSHRGGFGTWRRAWRTLDPSLSSWPGVRRRHGLADQFDDRLEEEYFTWLFDKVYRGGTRSWDFLWLYSRWKEGGLAVVPDVNLVSNIGFGPDATHTRYENDPFAALPVTAIERVIHPPEVVRHREADRFLFESAYATPSWRSPTGRARRRLANLRDRVRFSWRRFRGRGH